MAALQLVLFLFKLDKPTTHLHIMTVQARLNTWLSLWLCGSSSHRVTGSGTSPGSSGTMCWPMSSGTDCGPRKVGSANMSRTQTVCFLSSMTSCERRCQSCCGRGRSPFRWHLPQTRRWVAGFTAVHAFEGRTSTYQHRRTAAPPSGSVGHNRWSKSFH